MIGMGSAVRWSLCRLIVHGIGLWRAGWDARSSRVLAPHSRYAEVVAIAAETFKRTKVCCSVVKRTHARTHAHTHARAGAHTHTHACAQAEHARALTLARTGCRGDGCHRADRVDRPTRVAPTVRQGAISCRRLRKATVCGGCCHATAVQRSARNCCRHMLQDGFNRHHARNLRRCVSSSGHRQVAD